VIFTTFIHSTVSNNFIPLSHSIAAIPFISNRKTIFYLLDPRQNMSEEPCGMIAVRKKPKNKNRGVAKAQIQCVIRSRRTTDYRVRTFHATWLAWLYWFVSPPSATLDAFLGLGKLEVQLEVVKATMFETQTKISSTRRYEQQEKKQALRKLLGEESEKEDATHGRLRIQMPLYNKRGAMLRG
jgi:hypothetical protein